MSRFEFKLPKMGESIAEATVTSWLKKVGDSVETDEPIIEIATDKIDSEVPSEVSGTLVEIFFKKDEVVKVGQTLAVIETEEDLKESSTIVETSEFEIPKEEITESVSEIEKQIEKVKETTKKKSCQKISNKDRFYSPLIRSIANKEGISQSELDAIPGTGLEGRLTKDDILGWLSNRTEKKLETTFENHTKTELRNTITPLSVGAENKSTELSRMGKMISDHMIHSIHKSAHVQSFIEVDVTNLVSWRNKVKEDFLTKENEKLTYTPIFMIAVAAAIKKYPLVNLSFDGDKKFVIHKKINLGMAAALADGNLIVPVIFDADKLNLTGMAKAVNDLSIRAKENKLNPDEIKGGTYTVTNIGSFGSLFGTPIINQPESAILALGAIQKVPAVLETIEGDVIAIRQKMFLSHSYDHRVINGALGGLFIKFIKDYLESWNTETGF